MPVAFLAERIANIREERVLIIDKRPHIAGNAFDMYNDDGLLIHKYGPHIFHTNAERIFSYLSRFTEWRPYEHRVLADINGQLLPVPINLDTVNIGVEARSRIASSPGATGQVTL